MRKVRIDSKFLGIFSNSLSPCSTYFGKIPSNVNNNQRILTRRGDSLQLNLTSEGNKSISTATNPIYFKKMDEFPGDSDYFNNEENCDNLERRTSTFEDVNIVTSILKEVFDFQTKNVSSWIVESKVKTLCRLYSGLLKPHRYEFIQVLAKDYAVNHKQVCQAAKALGEIQGEEEFKIVKSEDRLRNSLTPQYSWLFMHIGKLEKGVKFLVDLRTDVLDLVSESSIDNSYYVELQQLNTTLRELLSMWFSVGFLDLERVTWQSSCDMLQKISEYEAVHPVRSWTDLKRRVGPYRRCFVYLHSSMPREPLVVLHTALSDEISCSMKGIVTARSRMSIDQSAEPEAFIDPQCEDPQKIQAAVFYSITSTQKGLQGIELGNYLIKRVVKELQNEFPHITQFSSLSPIPTFKNWLMEKLKGAERGQNDVLTQEEIEKLRNHLNSSDFWRELKRLISSNTWADDTDLITLLESPLMRLCTRYLYLEKRRGYAFDSVANFHLRNGAVMWRLNWRADLSPRGLSNSCGLMVNYRYFLQDAELNSRTYLEKQIISASDQILKLADQAQALMVVSKM